MAGLAEACTHIAALLFWVEMVIKIHHSKTDSGTFLQPEMLFNIDFRSPQFKKKSIEKYINSSSTVPKDGLNSPPMKRKSAITKATSSKMDIFFENLMKSDKKTCNITDSPRIC